MACLVCHVVSVCLLVVWPECQAKLSNFNLYCIILLHYTVVNLIVKSDPVYRFMCQGSRFFYTHVVDV